MAQYIVISKVDSEHNILSTLNVNFAEVINNLYQADEHKDDFPILSKIDPYGDTIMDISQVKLILDEIEKLNIDSEIKDSIRAFIIDIKQNEYVKFIGD